MFFGDSRWSFGDAYHFRNGHTHRVAKCYNGLRGFWNVLTTSFWGARFCFHLGFNFAFQFFFSISPWACRWKGTQEGVHWRMARFINCNRRRRKEPAGARMTSTRQSLWTKTMWEKMRFSKPGSRKRILELNQVGKTGFLCHIVLCHIDLLWIVLAGVTVLYKPFESYVCYLFGRGWWEQCERIFWGGSRFFQDLPFKTNRAKEKHQSNYQGQEETDSSDFTMVFASFYVFHVFNTVP